MKEKIKNLYNNKKWKEFSLKSIEKKGAFCSKCKRTRTDKYPDGTQVVLQLHHTHYEKNKKPWDYELSDLEILCKGCHAREHNILEPDDGWILVDIIDTGGLNSSCEKQTGINKSCDTPIRYEHEIYHPDPKIGGYRIVGSTCIEHLTEEDRNISKDVINFYKLIDEKLNSVLNNKNLPRGWRLNQHSDIIRYKSTKKINQVETKFESYIYPSKYSKKLFMKIDNKPVNYRNRYNKKIDKYLYCKDIDTLKKIILFSELTNKYKKANKIHLAILSNRNLQKILKEANYEIVS